MSEILWDVFISYKRIPDEQLALDLLAALERTGLRCWIAPRDVRLTSQKMAERGISDGGWDTAIPYAIEHSRMMVIVVSKAAMESRQIQKEIYTGDVVGIKFLPVLIEDISLESSFRFHLGREQWINCFTGEGSQRFGGVATEVAGFLGIAPGSASTNQPALAQSMSESSCPSCGGGNLPEARFCGSCGLRLALADAPASGREEDASPTSSEGDYPWTVKSTPAIRAIVESLASAMIEARPDKGLLFTWNSSYLKVVPEIEPRNTDFRIWPQKSACIVEVRLPDSTDHADRLRTTGADVQPSYNRQRGRLRITFQPNIAENVTRALVSLSSEIFGGKKSSTSKAAGQPVSAPSTIESGCPSCGEGNLPEARFCGSCGLRLALADAPAPGREEDASPTSSEGDYPWTVKSTPAIRAIVESLASAMIEARPDMGLMFTWNSSYLKVVPGIEPRNTDFCIWPQKSACIVEVRLPDSTDHADRLRTEGAEVHPYNHQHGRQRIAFGPTVAENVTRALVSLLSEIFGGKKSSTNKAAGQWEQARSPRNSSVLNSAATGNFSILNSGFHRRTRWS